MPRSTDPIDYTATLHTMGRSNVVEMVNQLNPYPFGSDRWRLWRRRKLKEAYEVAVGVRATPKSSSAVDATTTRVEIEWEDEVREPGKFEKMLLDMGKQSTVESIIASVPEAERASGSVEMVCQKIYAEHARRNKRRKELAPTATS